MLIRNRREMVEGEGVRQWREEGGRGRSVIDSTRGKTGVLCSMLSI